MGGYFSDATILPTAETIGEKYLSKFDNIKSLNLWLFVKDIMNMNIVNIFTYI